MKHRGDRQEPPGRESPLSYDSRDHRDPNITELNTLAEELVERWFFTLSDGKLGEVFVTFRARATRQ